MFVSNPPTEREQLAISGGTVTSRWWRWFASITTFLERLEAEVTLNFPSTSAQTSSDLTVTVPGAGSNGFDFAEVSVPNTAMLANTCYFAWVSAADTVTVRFNNYSSSAKDPASAVFKLRVTRN